MIMDQCAFYCATDEAAANVKALFGLADATWVLDTVTASVQVTHPLGVACETSINVAELQFCENLGMQFEIIRYVLGPHWCEQHPLKNEKSFIAHVGLHLESHEDFPPMDGCLMVQEAKTISHSNPAMGTKRYHYRIYELANGTYIKFIKRTQAQ